LFGESVTEPSTDIGGRDVLGDKARTKKEEGSECFENVNRKSKNAIAPMKSPRTEWPAIATRRRESESSEKELVGKIREVLREEPEPKWPVSTTRSLNLRKTRVEIRDFSQREVQIATPQNKTPWNFS
jgi:hypothetical protein